MGKTARHYLSIALTVVLCFFSVPFGTLRTEASTPTVSGEWEMVANQHYQYRLELEQRGNRITGTMTRTNGKEPIDRITGRVRENGSLEFTRHRAGAWEQHYRGEVDRRRGSIVMEGTFNQDGKGIYAWSARQASHIGRPQVTIDTGRQSRIEGQWSMVANRDYTFVLSLDQRGNNLTGTMTRTNGKEPVNRITGRVHDNGVVEFTRHGNGWTQQYRGEINRRRGEFVLEGMYTHNGHGKYAWSARKADDANLPIVSHDDNRSRIERQWSMVANRHYMFTLSIDQRGSQIIGTMTRTNGHEPVNKIVGVYHSDGRISFTRYGQGWQQHYQGRVFKHRHEGWVMEGSFDHNGADSYAWSAKLQ